MILVKKIVLLFLSPIAKRASTFQGHCRDQCRLICVFAGLAVAGRTEILQMVVAANTVDFTQSSPP